MAIFIESIQQSESVFPELFYVQFSFYMLKKMFRRFILPTLHHLFPKQPLPSKSLRHVKFDTNRKYVATHIKSVYEKVKVFLISDVGLCNDIVEHRMLKDNPVNFIGLDCEWDSSKKNGVALIQLSSGNDCVLYRLSKTNGGVPENLKKLLEDKKVLKFGVAIHEDVRRLRSHGIFVKGFVDLRNLAQRCLPHQNEELSSTQDDELYQWTSLRSLSYNALDMRLNKNHQIRCGDWEAPSLTKQQIMYAAKDAIVSLEIFYALVLLRKLDRHEKTLLKESFVTNVELYNKWEIRSCWENLLFDLYCYYHSSDSLTELDVNLPSPFALTKPSPWLTELAYSLCQGIVDTTHKYRPPVNFRSMQNISKRQLSTKAGQVKTYKNQCRDKPLYENCFLLGPDKKVLATVNHSKAQWYVHKGLGVVDSESPFTVRLLFEPSGRPMPDADYYTTVKDNICVVCGGADSFIRKMVIPHDYRKYFPQSFKDHMSHDVLLMCLGCHRLAQQGDEQLRQELAIKYDSPMGTKRLMMFVDDPVLSKVRSAAKALLHSGSKIPKERRSELEDIVKKYYEVPDIDESLLCKAVKTNVKMENKSFEGLHGERVVKSVIKEGKLEEFVRMWRKHFLEYMQPKFLPQMWSVEHNLHKLASNQRSVEYNHLEKLVLTNETTIQEGKVHSLDNS